jgi:exodeoxyribonuclease V alpha subunit
LICFPVVVQGLVGWAMKQLTLKSSGSGAGRGTLEGVLERIVYVNPESGWSVVRLEVPGRPDAVTAVGHLPGVQPGESLRLSGAWVQDHRWGDQFKVESFVTVQPSTLVGMEKYLGSGLVRGIGRVMAARLVKRFGHDTFDVIENQPQRITEVEGIGPKRKAQIIEAWAEQKAVKDVMLFLQSHGISSTFATKIYKHYGDEAISKVKNNPYRLALDIYGIGFKSADRIALDLGISMTSPRRAEAGVFHVLARLTDEGHVYCPRERLVDSAVEILQIEEPVIQTALDALAEQQQVVVDSVPEGQAVYPAALHACERGAARRLAELLSEETQRVALDLPAAVAWVQDQLGLELADMQREALARAAGSRVLVITGGPGTGKTTTVNAILRVLQRQGRRILLCAPTGRAARRLAETSGREASTIHRLLEFDPRRQRFARDADNPLSAQVLVVDEVSMVDVVLLHALLKAVPSGCQLILVGDVDQLPSVGPGAVLQDLIFSGAVDVVRLTEIFRQAQQSLIVVNAHRVNGGQLPLSPPTSPEQEADDAAGLPDFFFIERQEPEQVLATLKEIVSRRLPRRFGLDPVNQIQVLTPMHRGSLGAIQLNRELQDLLNPEGQTLVRGTRLLRVGDKVMQLRNNYDHEVFNGDLGRVLAIDEVERQLEVAFDERRVVYDHADLDELVLGYACTIHKSQGSEYPAVVVPLHTQHYPMLQRNLLYTAITRGQRLVVLVGNRKAAQIAVNNSHVLARYSRLGERLRLALT